MVDRAGALTTYQAKILLAGKPGPFRFGEYRVVDRLRRQGGGHFLVAVHTDTGRQVVLHFFTAATRPVDEAAAFAATNDALAEIGRDLGTASRYVQVGGFLFTVVEPPADSSLAATEGITLPPDARIEIDIEAEPRHAALTRRIPRAGRRWLTLGLGLVAIVGAILVAAWTLGPRESGRPVATSDPSTSAAQVPETPAPAATASAVRPSSRERIVPDDGQLLWASPTAGDPLSLAYLPAGSQILCLLRPHQLMHAPEGPRVLAAVGPWGQALIEAVERDLKCPLAAVDMLLIGIQFSPTEGGLLPAFVAELRPEAVAATRQRWQAESQSQPLAAQTVFTTANRSAWFPPSRKDRLMVVCPGPAGGVDWLREVIEANGSPPPLRREMEQLVAASDSNRHLTFLAAPSSLFNQQTHFFRGPLQKLREPTAWLLGGEVGRVQAVALSLHFSDHFFLEFREAATAEISPRTLAQGLQQRVGEIALAVEDHIIGLPQIHRYGRRIVMRLPAMIRSLAAYTRVGIEDDHAVVRAYLPVAAGHNLLLATDLLLHESAARPASETVPANAAAEPSTRTIEDRLAAEISLSFDRETLEDALQLWSETADVAVELLGSDLQLEGITKNQSFGIDLQQRPAEEILIAILRAANPDPTATGPDDPLQKLIYIVKPPAVGSAESGREIVWITTRAQAQARGDPLPAAFQ